MPQIFKTRPPLAFTKGPWRIDLDRVLAGAQLIAVVGDDDDASDWEANAVLIASAPAMYACLRAVRAYYTAMWSGDAKKAVPGFLAPITDLLNGIEPPEARHES